MIIPIIIFMVGAPRFELGLNPPEGLVLPLHYAPLFYVKLLCYPIFLFGHFVFFYFQPLPVFPRLLS
jgi:hypothetical protein